MFGREEIAGLELRKRALVIESELNRLALRTEWQRVCDATGWISHAARFWRQANPWLVALAPVVGVLTARTLGGEGGIVRRLLGMLKWIQPLMTVWRSVMGAPGAEGPSKPADA
jgi:hypothetical protein